MADNINDKGPEKPEESKAAEPEVREAYFQEPVRVGGPPARVNEGEPDPQSMVRCEATSQPPVYRNTVVRVKADVKHESPGIFKLCWYVDGKREPDFLKVDENDETVAYLDTKHVQGNSCEVEARLIKSGLSCDEVTPEHPGFVDSCKVNLLILPLPNEGPLTVALQSSQRTETRTLTLWSAIRQSTKALSFSAYETFINAVMCGDLSALTGDNGNGEVPTLPALSARRGLPYPGIDAYKLLKDATELYLMVNCGVEGDRLEDFELDLARPDVAEFLGRTGIKPVNRKLSLAEISDGSSGSLVRTLPFLSVLYSRVGRPDLVRPRTTSGGYGADDLGAVCEGIFERKFTRPCLLELIWSYWHEEGMLVQTLNAVSVRFQNKRAGALRDPLKRLNIDYLRGINNLLWGYIQDEPHRLSVVRRAYEYDHHYGLTLEGKAVPKLNPVDSRSKFLEAFHNLLHLATVFFQQDDDLTVRSDAFPLINALREVHLLLAEGMDNQFGDLPSTARMEMLMQQWLLARTEMREFLGGRPTTPYTEAWMDRVDTMKTLQGWTDVSVTYFNDLAVVGEQLLLSIRYGGWSDPTLAPSDAANWALSWRPEIQRYIHSYRAVTGVDLAANGSGAGRTSGRYLPPSVHLRERLAVQRRDR